MTAAVTTLQAVSIAADLLQAAAAATQAAVAVSQIIAKAQAEGRELSAADWQALDALDATARARLDQAIAERGDA